MERIGNEGSDERFQCLARESPEAEILCHLLAVVSKPAEKSKLFRHRFAHRGDVPLANAKVHQESEKLLGWRCIAFFEVAGRWFEFGFKQVVDVAAECFHASQSATAESGLLELLRVHFCSGEVFDHGGC